MLIKHDNSVQNVRPTLRGVEYTVPVKIGNVSCPDNGVHNTKVPQIRGFDNLALIDDVKIGKL